MPKLNHARLSAKTLRVVFTLIFGLTLNVSCTSLQSKAEKLMQEKSFEDAEKIYLQILRKHPQDVDAIVGLKHAREGVISSQLLLVRRERLSGSADQANELLKTIMERSAHWKVYPGGAVAFTQNEEIEYAVQSIAQHVGELLSVNHPLKAAYLMDHFEILFQEKYLPLLDRLHKNASQIGLTRCRQNLLTVPAERGYYREFLARECRYWGDTREILKQPIQHGLIGHLNLEGTVVGLPMTITPVFEKAIHCAIEQSPWYEASSLKHVKVVYSGQFAFTTERHSTEFTQAYEEQIPYTSIELVTKTRTVMKPVTHQVFQVDGTTKSETHLESTQETYNDMEPVTRMRSETRYFRYPGFEIDQNISLNAVADLQLPGTSQPSHLTGSKIDRNLTTESTTEIPRINLYRKIAKINEVNDWSNQIIEGWRVQILTELNEAWSASHCNYIQASTVITQQADEVFACMRNTSQPTPPAVDAWLSKNLGLPSLELQSLLM